MNKYNKLPHSTKRVTYNNQGTYDWQYGDPNSNIIIENKNLGVSIVRYNIESSDGHFLYDTISIIEPTNNCVVIIVNEENEIGLVYEWRPIPDKWFWACVRGFGNPEDPGVLHTAKREMIEEVGNCKIVAERLLGKIYHNTTFFENSIGVVVLHVKNLCHKLQESEGIVEFCFFNESTIRDMIKAEKIEDQITISALAKYLVLKDSL